MAIVAIICHFMDKNDFGNTSVRSKFRFMNSLSSTNLSLYFLPTIFLSTNFKNIIILFQQNSLALASLSGGEAGEKIYIHNVFSFYTGSIHFVT